MPTISYPTQAAFPGPWLVDAKELRELDSLLDALSIKVRERLDGIVESAVEEEIAKTTERRTPHAEQQERERLRQQIIRRFREARTATIELSGGRTVEGERFSDIKAVPSAMGERPTGFRAFLRVAEFQLAISLNEYYLAELKVEVRSDDDEFSQEAFGRVRCWIADFEPGRLLRRWYKVNDAVGSIPLFAWAFLFFLLAGSIVVDSPKDDLKSEARQLLAQGITPANTTRAIELTLAVESDYVPPSHAPNYRLSMKFWGFFLLGMIVLVCLRICPKMEIGLWAGRRLEKWRAWMRTVSVTIPATFCLYILLPWIPRFLKLSPH
jgi:hypothetical protein